MLCPRTNASLEPLLIGGITVYTSVIISRVNTMYRYELIVQSA